jgi:electron transport complex protein RnfD
VSDFLTTTLTTSPHFKKQRDVPTIMRHVIYALLPVVAFSVYNFGLSALLIILFSTATCVFTERIYNYFTNNNDTISDGSAIITGILLGLTLPPGFPLWMTSLGAVFSILVGKMIFGGLGFNPFNPALVGRAFLQTAFPTSITTWVNAMDPHRFTTLREGTLAFPFMRPIVDGISGATPLAAFKFDQIKTPVSDLLFGGISGSAGETCAIIILLSGLYLAWRGFLDWRIPCGILFSAAVLSMGLHLWSAQMPSPLFTILSGGLMLGAVFMATDMVTSPITPLGVWIWSAMIGILVVIIRVFGGLPEGVMYAILLANGFTPLMNRWFKPKTYGHGK